MTRLNYYNSIEKVKCFNEILELRVKTTPDAISLVCEGRKLTYKELNHKVNQLANFLKKQGVVPEARVGIYAERSLDIVIAILGILKAGGAYVPLDPAYPQERISLMLEDTQAPLGTSKK